MNWKWKKQPASKGTGCKNIHQKRRLVTICKFCEMVKYGKKRDISLCPNCNTNDIEIQEKKDQRNIYIYIEKY